MRKRTMLLEALDSEIQLNWTTSGDEILEQDAALWCTYTGQKEEAVRNWGWIEALHPDDRSRARQLWSQAVEHKHFYETWYRIRNREGVYHTFTLKCMPLFISVGQERSLRGWICELAPASVETMFLASPGWRDSLFYNIHIDQYPVGVALFSLDGRYLLVNKRFCSTVGYSCDELLGQKLEFITLPEDIKISYEAIEAQIREELKSVYSFKKRYISKNGETIWVRVHSSLLRLPSGEPSCFFAVIEDITEQKRAEEEQKRLLEFERAVGTAERRAKQEALALATQFEGAFNAVPELILVCDLEGKMLLLNTSGQRFLAMSSEEEWRGKPFSILSPRVQVFDEQGHYLPAEQWPINRILKGEVLENQQAVDITVHMRWGYDAQLSISGAPVFDLRGAVIGGVCVFRDVTAARQRERRVQQALNALLTIVEDLSYLPELIQRRGKEKPHILPPTIEVVGKRLVAKIREVLQCQYVSCISIAPETGRLHMVGIDGVTEEEERRYAEAVNQLSLNQFIEPATVARLQRNEAVVRDMVTQPYLVLPPAGFDARYRLLTPMLIDKQPVGILAIGKSEVDATYTAEETALAKAIARLIVMVIERVRLLHEWAESRASEMALAEATRRFDAFLSIASHELRTPLTTIKGNVQLAARRLETLKTRWERRMQVPDLEALAEGFDRVLQPLQAASHRTRVQERMISDLLDASRIRADKLELVLRPCKLVDIVRTTVEDLQQFATDRVVTLHMPEEKVVPIIADSDRIGQVINNYLVNAIRYSPVESPIDVSLDIIEHGTKARVSVRDQGSGIAPEDLGLIWERFYRGSTNEMRYDTGGAGLGLGLHIARKIIELHHGQVGIESERGKGSNFWFTLPLAPQEGV